MYVCIVDATFIMRLKKPSCAVLLACWISVVSNFSTTDVCASVSILSMDGPNPRTLRVVAKTRFSSITRLG